ncbi:hypothetical protein ACQKWADRAFT_327374 [Trichoderma austrokoningii]
MTDANTNFDPDKTTIVAASHQCLESFTSCLAQVSAIHPREFSRVEDQATRFSTWASGIGVFAPGRASMDHRLRYALEVQSVAVPVGSDTMDGHGKNPESDVSAQSKALGRSYSDIALEISHLNKSLKIQNFQVKNEDKSVERILLDNFKHHIRDSFLIASSIIHQRLAEAMILRRKRILYWRYRQQEAATKFPNTPLINSQTLPEPQQLASTTQANLPQEDKQETRAAEPEVASSEIRRATTLQPDQFEIAATSPSAMSIALSGHEALSFPTAPGADIKRKYEEIKKRRLAAHKYVLYKLDKAYPDDDSERNPLFDEQRARAIAEENLKITLEADLQALGEITCPYYLEAIPAIEVFDHRKWRKHVENDLDPYVCLFEECNEADELYKHSEKWLSHMHQHNQRWRCPSHRELDPFLTREEYMQHMREIHNFKLGEEKLLILANRNARKTTKLFTSCPLCGKNEAGNDGRLENHIAGHLRSLALKSLPPHPEVLM